MKEYTRILVVDDEVLIQNILRKILEKEGYQVRTATSGSEALKLMAAEPADIVISDVRMPEMDGFELLKQLKESYPASGVIMMTGFSDAYSIKDALLLGADEYVTKPFKSYEIALIVERTYWRMLSARNRETREGQGA